MSHCPKCGCCDLELLPCKEGRKAGNCLIAVGVPAAGLAMILTGGVFVFWAIAAAAIGAAEHAESETRKWSRDNDYRCLRCHHEWK